MATIIVKNQKELDAVPLSFKEWTYVEIRTNDCIEVKSTYVNGQVTACGSSQVRAYGSSQVTACDSSQVRACDSSQVTAYGSSQVTAYGSSQVTAYGSSQVRAYGSSQVTAYGSSQVRAYGSSQVTACGNSMIAVLSAFVIMHKIAQYAVIALDGVTIKLPKKAKTATVIKRKLIEYDIDSFVDIWNLTVEKDYVILYKSVRKDTLCDFRTGKIKYEGTVTCPDFDSSRERECGGGLHLCATSQGALAFAGGPAKLLKCKVKLKDIVVYGKNIEKVRCRQVEVLGEV